MIAGHYINVRKQNVNVTCDVSSVYFVMYCWACKSCMNNVFITFSYMFSVYSCNWCLFDSFKHILFIVFQIKGFTAITTKCVLSASTQCRRRRKIHKPHPSTVAIYTPPTVCPNIDVFRSFLEYSTLVYPYVVTLLFTLELPRYVGVL